MVIDSLLMLHLLKTLQRCLFYANKFEPVYLYACNNDEQYKSLVVFADYEWNYFHSI